MTFLVLAGFVYYSFYYDCGFNTGDEGALVLLAMRILDGQRPYLDLQLGYGLLWYYPVVLLFEVTGASFVATRIYLLSLAVICALLGFLTVRRATPVMAVAVNVGLLVLALPGDLQNVYIPLVVLANMLAVSRLDLDRTVLDHGRVFVAALVAAVSWHIRAELGMAAAAVLGAILIAHALSHPPARWSRALARLSALIGAAALVPTLPLILIAASQGFLKAFLQFNQWPFRILTQIPTLVRTGAFVEIEPSANGASGTAMAEAPPGTTLARFPLAAIWEGGPRQIFAILTYLPLLTLAIIAAIAGYRMLRRKLEGRPVTGNDTIGVLALLGLALSSFPQFFLFRPEPGHLSFFMPGYVVLAAACLGRWLLPAGSSKTAAPSSGASGRRLAGLAFSGLMVAHVGLYFLYGVNLTTTGSMIAWSRGRTDRFLGQNGVAVAVSPNERRYFNAVSRIVEEHTNEDDYLLCFPFGPGWNVMTNRRTFGYSLYADDGLIASPWQRKTIAGIESKRPPVIIVDNWPINGTEISRFKNWATEVMDHLAAEYVLLEAFGDLEIHVRRKPETSGAIQPEAR